MQLEHYRNVTVEIRISLREDLQEVKNALPEQSPKAAAGERGIQLAYSHSS